MLTLGLPASAPMALMLGALLIQGIPPGPQMMTQRPDLFWGLIASMWIGNLMLLVLNLPLIGLWVKLLTVPYRLLFPAILAVLCIGIYSVNNSAFDVVRGWFGVPASCCRRWVARPRRCCSVSCSADAGREPAPSLLISRGDPVPVSGPISLALLVLAVVLLAAQFARGVAARPRR